MIDNVIKEIKEKTKDYNDIEKIRYVYLYLGNRISFDVKYNFESSIRRNIYKSIYYDKKCFNEVLSTGFGICKSIAYLFNYILKNLGFDTQVLVLDEYEKNCPHVYNVVYFANERLYFDLQTDLVYIKAHLKTKHFGKDEHDNLVINDNDLEMIDRKIGYISDEYYYADEYYYLLKSMTCYLDFEDKFKFLLDNFDVYNLLNNMKYIEFTRYCVNNFKIFFTSIEMRKINMYHMYKEIDGVKDYTVCFILDISFYDKSIYVYSKEKEKFINISVEEFYNKEYKTNGKMPRLRRY